jgi:hypothetical protein
MTERKPSMQKFRKENKRVDYYPMPDAVAAIERLRQHYPDAPTRALIDMLVMAGIKALTAKVTP